MHFYWRRWFQCLNATPRKRRSRCWSYRHSVCAQRCGAVLWAMLPPMIRQTIALVQSLPESIQAIKTAADAASDWLLRHASIELPPLTLGEAALPSLASGTMAIAGNIADATYRISLMVILAYFLLCDRKRLDDCVRSCSFRFPHEKRSCAWEMQSATSCGCICGDRC